jgi:GNAT superfamily N-acetyltransferase
VKILGLLKTGRKKLFLRTEDAKYHAREPVCVLDFYVQEAHQRAGIGSALFQARLAEIVSESYSA